MYTKHTPVYSTYAYSCHDVGERVSDITLSLCLSLGDSLSSLQKAVEQKETSRQQLREQLDAVERETRAKLLEIDAFNTQLKVNS